MHSSRRTSTLEQIAVGNPTSWPFLEEELGSNAAKYPAECVLIFEESYLVGDAQLAGMQGTMEPR